MFFLGENWQHFLSTTIFCGHDPNYSSPNMWLPWNCFSPWGMWWKWQLSLEIVPKTNCGQQSFLYLHAIEHRCTNSLLHAEVVDGAIDARKTSKVTSLQTTWNNAHTHINILKGVDMNTFRRLIVLTNSISHQDTTIISRTISSPTNFFLEKPSHNGMSPNHPWKVKIPYVFVKVDQFMSP